MTDELTVSCPNCGSENIWHQEWMYTRQTVSFYRRGSGFHHTTWPFDLEWGDNYENVYESTQDIENGLAFLCKDCCEELRADELVVTDPKYEHMMYQQADIGRRCNNGE